MTSLKSSFRFLAMTAGWIILLANGTPVRAGTWDALSPGAINGGRVGPLIAKDNAIYSAGLGPQPSYESIVRWMHCYNSWEPIGFIHVEGDWDNAITKVLVINGQSLYVGGRFTSVIDPVGNVTYATNIARFDVATSKWYSVGNGTTQVVRSIAIDSTGLIYIGTDGSSPGPQMMVWKWIGTSWAPLGQGLTPSSTGYRIANVTALLANGTDLFVGGNFTYGVNSNGTQVLSPFLIKWNGTQWITSGGINISMNVDPWIDKIAIAGNDLFVTGLFWNTIGGQSYQPPVCLDRFTVSPLQHSAAYTLWVNNDPTWSAPIYTDGYDLSSQNGVVYLAGDFNIIGPGSVAAPGVAQFTSATGWGQMGNFTGPGYHVRGSGIAADGNSSASQNAIYIDGTFTAVDGNPATYGTPVRWVLGAGDPACTSSGGTPLSRWKLQFDANDVYNLNNGTTNGNLTYIPAKVCMGIYLASKPAGVTVLDNSNLDFGAGADFSIDAWVRPTNAGTSYGVMDIVDKRQLSGSNAKGYELFLISGNLGV